jgi:GMP synthase-like glutamine amidotransferase
MPYWGACLGVQLLAASLGARVYQGPVPEVGLLPVSLTEAAAADPVFGGLPDEFLTLQWQFHLEVSVDMAREWGEVFAYAESLDRMLGHGSLPGLIREIEVSSGEMRPHGRALFERWLDTTVGA